MPELINPPKDLDMDTFRTLMSIYGGLAKTSRFVARINSSPLPMRDSDKDPSKIRKDLAYLCEAAELPGRGFLSNEIHYYGPTFKVPFQSSYEDLNLTFICRDSFLERQFFDDWLDVINPISTYDFAYRDEYKCSIDLFQMSDINDGTENPTPRYKFIFEDAWPILVNPQASTWADDNFQRLTISFTFKRWKRENFLNPIMPANFALVQGAELVGPGMQISTFDRFKL